MIKKFLIASFLLISILFLKTTEAAVEENRAYFPPVVLYHDVKLMPLNNFDVILKDFRKQLDWIKSAGYETLTMDEFIDIVQSGKEFPKRSILITFDDGYADAYAYAVPELKKRNMKATFFISSWYLNKITKGYPYMKDSEVKELANDPLFSIGSHTIKHVHLDKIETEYQIKELNASKEYLEKLTGKPIRALAYPFGDYNAEVIANTKAAGYEVAFAVNDRGLFNEPARFSIPRIYVGLLLCGNNQALFKEYVREYKQMPADAFIDRWQPLNK